MTPQDSLSFVWTEELRSQVEEPHGWQSYSAMLAMPVVRQIQMSG